MVDPTGLVSFASTALWFAFVFIKKSFKKLMGFIWSGFSISLKVASPNVIHVFAQQGFDSLR
jgi:hypothetical protein